MIWPVTHCVICEAGRPWDVIAETPAVWVTAASIAPLPGYVCVVSKHHVVEPFELDSSSASEFWFDCLRTARAIRDVLEAQKINYEIHGNTLPHLHMHVYPRYDGDPFEGAPINGAAAMFQRSSEDLERLRVALHAVM